MKTHKLNFQQNKCCVFLMVWSIRNIMRVNPVNGSASELIGQTITGQTSFATAIVTLLFHLEKMQINVVELELDPETINGTFD